MLEPTPLRAAESTARWSPPPARHQTSAPAEEILHSANCGLIVHRVGRINYGFRTEGRDFARALQRHVNKLTRPSTTLLYEEIFGTEDRFHWLVHLRAPNDYVEFIRMVDRDRALREIIDSNRLPEKGGGNWERMFAEASFQEHVIVPQHGITEVDDETMPFVPAARHQTSQSPDQLLHSASAGAIIARRGQVKYQFREEGRAFAYEWQSHINRKLAGDVTVLLYEETWGRQDRIHWLIHLRSLDDYGKLLAMGAEDEEYRSLFTRQWISASKGGGAWSRTFVDGTLADTVLIPHHEAMGTSWH